MGRIGWVYEEGMFPDSVQQLPPFLWAVLKFRPWPELYYMCSALLTWVWVYLVPYGLTHWPLDSMLNLVSPTTSSSLVCILQDCTFVAEDATHISFLSFLSPISYSLAQQPVLAAPQQAAQAISSLTPASHGLVIWLCTSFPQSPMASGQSPNSVEECSQSTSQVTALIPKPFNGNLWLYRA